MKDCSYCGRQNDDEAAHCRECGTDLPPPAATVEAATAGNGQAVSAGPPSLVLEADRLPGPWLARDGWKCLGVFAVFWVVTGLWFAAAGIVFPSFRHWSRSGVGYLFGYVFRAGIFLATIFYFSREQSLRSCAKRLGLYTPVSSWIWFGLVVVVVIRGLGHIAISAGWSRGVANAGFSGFRQSAGLERWLYVAPVLLFPFVEECYLRGFFYRAFRGSYSVVVSTLLVVAIALATHWTSHYRSWVALIGLCAGNVLLCFLRERSAGLWDCILCHFVYNATAVWASLLAP